MKSLFRVAFAYEMQINVFWMLRYCGNKTHGLELDSIVGGSVHEQTETIL